MIELRQLLNDKNENNFSLDGKIFLSNGLVFNSANMRIIGRISKAQYSILLHLHNNQGVIYSKEDLVNIGWGNKKVGVEAVVVAISQLRKILSKKYFVTVREYGYLFCLPEKSDQTNISKHI